jgi:hypothetical protein
LTGEGWTKRFDFAARLIGHQAFVLRMPVKVMPRKCTSFNFIIEPQSWLTSTQESGSIGIYYDARGELGDCDEVFHSMVF